MTTGTCDLCSKKHVLLLDLFCVGIGPDGRIHLKHWQVCVCCFYAETGVSMSNGIGSP
jgi:hypothetical protein